MDEVYMTDPITIVVPTAGAWGEKASETLYAISARVMWGWRLMRSQTGEQVTSRARIRMRPLAAVTVSTAHTVRFPDGSEFPILDVYKKKAFDAEVLEVMLG